MGENTYFQKALADFTYETASGGAIRHLADLGYTVKQIGEMLDYPTPCERIQKTVWEHLVSRAVILLEEPGNGSRTQKTVYVKEYDKYGKSTFRRVTESVETERVLRWKERRIGEGEGGTAEGILTLLKTKIEENGEDRSYASFDFGLTAGRDPGQYQKMLQLLEDGQREYILGLPWERRRVYHRLDLRMTDILVRLYEAGQYEGECYFLETREKFSFSIKCLKESEEDFFHESK